MSPCKLARGPIIDTATGTDVIGADSVACATNIQVSTPFEFSTMAGTGVSKQRGDLSTPLIDIKSAPTVKAAATSLISATTIHDNGYTTVSDNSGMTLQRDGLAHEEVRDGNMFRLLVVEKAKIDAEVNLAVARHRKTIIARMLKKMIEHRKRAHRPTDPDGCDGCALQMSRKLARRLKPDARRHGEDRGLVVGMHYITGLPADNDGNIAAVGLAVASRAEGKLVAWYHPVKPHSGDDVIAAFKECEFRLSQLFPPGEFRIARVHCDCEPSLIGPLIDKYGQPKQKGTTTTVLQ